MPGELQKLLPSDGTLKDQLAGVEQLLALQLSCLSLLQVFFPALGSDKLLSVSVETAMEQIRLFQLRFCAHTAGKNTHQEVAFRHGGLLK